MEEMQKLLEIMERLRGNNGCNWDRQQTHESLTPYVLEEAYEVVDAIESGNKSNLKEELGDLLFQVVFHSKIASETGDFSFRDVVNGISDKLVRRHPHVFQNSQSLSSEEVLKNWEIIKSEEKGMKTGGSILDDVPVAMPAIQRSEKLQSKASSVGFDWENPLGVLDKIREECNELEKEIRESTVNKARIREEWGDLVFSLVNLARFFKINPEDGIRATNQKFEKRFKAMEMNSGLSSKDLKNLSTEEWEVLWQKSKKQDSL